MPCDYDFYKLMAPEDEAQIIEELAARKEARSCIRQQGLMDREEYWKMLDEES